jgi:hypothetical protein
VVALNLSAVLRDEYGTLQVVHGTLALLLCLVESRNKSWCLEDKSWSPYAIAGTLDRLLYVWINPFLRLGRRGLLSEAPPLSPETRANVTREKAIRAWHHAGERLSG